jgi:RNA polymerase sigma factor (sigma-70 family)
VFSKIRQGERLVSTAPHRGLLRQLDGLFAIGSTAELTDGQLLERFITLEGERGEQAFATLVDRHGPMVLRVCRGVLADSHDSEDAFQATFLVLVRKARRLWVDDSLGPWLHQVALRTASGARLAAVRRRKHERAKASRFQEPHAEAEDNLAFLLHEEINRLPDRFRLPLILCDLEGHTNEQAARHLGWPIGTVKSRLARARERLRHRLTRRGLAPTAAALGPGLRPSTLSALVPDALVSSTTRAAIQFAATRTLLGGSGAFLAQGVLTAMSMTRWWKAASVLLVAGATISGVGLLAGHGQTSMPVVEVNAGQFKVSTTGRGSLEVEQSNEVISQVDSNITVISMLPDGAKVKKGDVGAELDSAALRNQLINQRVATKAAEANFQNAMLTREVAEIAIREYQEGIYAQDRATIQGEIKLAESTRKKAQARLERTKRARQQLTERMNNQHLTGSDIIADLDMDDRLDSAEQAVTVGTFSLERAQTKLEVLENYTKPKTIKELRSEVEKARSTELAKQVTWEYEKAKELGLERQIENCKLVSPADGLLVHGDDVDKSSIVRPQQRLFWVFEPNSRMVVNVKVPESMVDRVSVGQKARIEVDAFPGQALDGVVTKVARLPDTTRPPSTHKVYSTLVRIDESFGGRRPGMTAQAEILISERDHVLTAPVQSILQYGGQDHVAVRKSDGGFEWREVRLGEGSPSLVEVKEGLKPGEKIAIQPIELLSPEERRQKFGGDRPKPTPPAAAKK